MDFKKFFEEQGRIRKQITIERYRQLNPHAKKGQILFAGSSLAEQFPVNEMLMSRGLDFMVYNRGLSGAVTKEFADNLDTLVLDLEPRQIFINIGSNDIGSMDYDEASFFEEYKNVIHRIIQALPHTKLILMAFYPVNPNKESHVDEEARRMMFTNRTNSNIQSVNKKVQKLCQDLSLTYLDVNKVLLDGEGQLKESLTVEGVHLWPDAYEAILDNMVGYFI